MAPRLVLTDAPELAARDAILRPLVHFNRSRSGQAENYRPLAVLLLHPDTGEVTGGLWGATYYRQLFVELLFVPEEQRGSGIGRRIMREAEEEAQRRGCLGVWLDTYSFQARGFYERLGYGVFGTIEDYPPGHSRFFLKKSLAGPAPP